MISVASNVIPQEVANMVRAFASGKPALALKLHSRFYPLFKDLFVETNPVPVKTAMAMLGDDRGGVPAAAGRDEPEESRVLLKCHISKQCGIPQVSMTKLIIPGPRGTWARPCSRAPHAIPH